MLTNKDLCCQNRSAPDGKNNKIPPKKGFGYIYCIMRKMAVKGVWVAGLLILAGSCQKNPPAADNPTSFPLASGVLEEASGITDSRQNSGMLWVQEDSGNPPELSLLSHEGKLVRTIPVTGAANTDWEDIALAAGPDPALDYLYIGDIGDNDQVRTLVTIYRGREVAANASSIPVETINFRYEDGPHDAEALLVEPGSLDIYLLTKRDTRSGIYRLQYPYSTTAVNVAVKLGELPYTGVVSAAMTADGTGVAVKDYFSIRYYTRLPGEPLSNVLAKPFTSLAYTMEQQGEAVCFTNDGKYYFTLSEKLNGPVSLIKYQR